MMATSKFYHYNDTDYFYLSNKKYVTFIIDIGFTTIIMSAGIKEIREFVESGTEEFMTMHQVLNKAEIKIEVPFDKLKKFIEDQK